MAIKTMHISKDGLELIKQLEGLPEKSKIIKDHNIYYKPYLCPAQKPTIGYGATFYESGEAVKLNDPPITIARAVQLLEHILETFENCLNEVVKVELKQNQVDAVLSFMYNVGMGNFKRSTLLKKINKMDFQAAANEFDRWVYVNKNKKLDGLMFRRAKEKALFLR